MHSSLEPEKLRSSEPQNPDFSKSLFSSQSRITFGFSINTWFSPKTRESYSSVVDSEEFEPEALVESGVAHQKDDSVLEELYLGSSFNDVNRIEETKATFTELCRLSNFTTLVIYLERFAYWPRDLVLMNLKAFAITTGIRTRYLFERMIGTRDCRDYQLQNQLSLEDLHKSDLMESGFKNLFKITKILGITRAIGVKNVGYELDKDGFKKLTELLLKDCQDLEYVICTTDGVSVPQIAFPVLQWLRLDNLDKLKKICRGQLPEEAFSELKWLELRNLPALTHLWKGPTQLVRLRNLTSLKLKRCDKLESMLSLSIARDLMQLQRLDVSKCRKMEVLISSEEGDQNEIASTTTDKIEFPKLKRLYLKRLPSFSAICKAMNGIELLQLNELTLSQLPKLNSFCNTSDSNYDTIQPLFNKVCFSNLSLFIYLFKFHCSRVSINFIYYFAIFI
ncbi:hypothetical protein HYC85_022514 [Camellia sinensis]|uniref:Disease resistance protein At4g27190-like leucine-rich repeats domain-containing protein n=1 Tax=Camellia sinensis TaxID=4442 RepID=A0A7J7GLH2_CAMSI|nr:hypothetical protein HYC85_022514 [Camellia sinensis]